MKPKIFVIVGLSALFITLSIFLSLGVGIKYPSLIDEELSVYNNRKVYTALSTPADRYGYALGVSTAFGYITNCDSIVGCNSNEFIAPAYNILTQQNNTFYYMGLVPEDFPTNLNKVSPGYDFPLNSMVLAGYIQSMERNSKIPQLSGDAAKNYIEEFMTKMNDSQIAERLIDLMRKKGHTVSDNTSFMELSGILKLTKDNQQSIRAAGRRSLEIRERLAQMQKDESGRSWGTLEEMNAYYKEWDKEKAALDKELEDITQLLNSFIPVK